MNWKKFLRKKNLCEKSIVFSQYSAGDHIWDANAFSVDFNSLSLTSNFFTENNTVSGTLPTNLETFFRIKIFFRKNFFLFTFDNTSDYWRLRKNAFAAQIWSSALYRRKIMHFSLKKFFRKNFFQFPFDYCFIKKKVFNL